MDEEIEESAFWAVHLSALRLSSLVFACRSFARCGDTRTRAAQQEQKGGECAAAEWRSLVGDSCHHEIPGPRRRMAAGMARCGAGRLTPPPRCSPCGQSITYTPSMGWDAIQSPLYPSTYLSLKTHRRTYISFHKAIKRLGDRTVIFGMYKICTAD